MKLPVLARHIQHLTDARYFAALEVEYIAFNLDEGSPSYVEPLQLHAIIDWIEGPTIVIENPGAETFAVDTKTLLAFPFEPDDNQDAYFIELPLSALAQNHLPKAHAYILKIEAWNDLLDADWTQIYQLAEFGKLFVETDLNAALINYLLDNHPTVGIVLSGSQEEKTGIKSYEELDEILELLDV